MPRRPGTRIAAEAIPNTVPARDDLIELSDITAKHKSTRRRRERFQSTRPLLVLVSQPSPLARSRSPRPRQPRAAAGVWAAPRTGAGLGDAKVRDQSTRESKTALFC